jgi:hypothetical protein
MPMYMAFLSLFLGNSIEEVLIQTISTFYNFSTQHKLFHKSMNPVIIEMLESNTNTKPPNTKQ